jgi:DNA polymerase (family 10)
VRVTGGLDRAGFRRQMRRIDRLNASLRRLTILKGAEVDIHADGRLDLDDATLAALDLVCVSIHSAFDLGEREQTRRVLAALRHPSVDILGHPTGRLLLTREAYAIDIEAVIQKATEVGVAVELNADPHRLDIDWRYCQMARQIGCTIEIGPDAHSQAGLDNMQIGIGVARKGWLEASDVLNTGTAEDVLQWARARREV